MPCLCWVVFTQHCLGSRDRKQSVKCMVKIHFSEIFLILHAEWLAGCSSQTPQWHILSVGKFRKTRRQINHPWLHPSVTGRLQKAKFRGNCAVGGLQGLEHDLYGLNSQSKAELWDWSGLSPSCFELSPWSFLELKDCPRRPLLAHDLSAQKLGMCLKALGLSWYTDDPSQIKEDAKDAVNFVGFILFLLLLILR